MIYNPMRRSWGCFLGRNSQQNLGIVQKHPASRQDISMQFFYNEDTEIGNGEKMSLNEQTTILLIGNDTTLNYLLGRFAERCGYRLSCQIWKILL